MSRGDGMVDMAVSFQRSVLDRCIRFQRHGQWVDASGGGTTSVISVTTRIGESLASRV